MPLTIVMLGATGDLFQKKLAGALFELFRGGFLEKSFRVVGISRKEMSDVEFWEFVHAAVLQNNHKRRGQISEFVSRFFYHRGDIGEQETYQLLADFLEASDTKAGECSNKLFYLAVRPALYETVFKNLAKSGLTVPCAPRVRTGGANWCRVLVEKPFGNNLKEAERLDRVLGRLFDEKQIFRIDHYLAKEALQNILSFRFSNSTTEPLWNSTHIEQVEIKFFERGVVGARGAFYDGVGALRDVGQNHMLEMLALVAMERPTCISAECIRKERARVLRAVRIPRAPLADFAARAQYDGYRAEKGVSPNSETETYFKIKLGIENDRWRRVPFILESGKGLPESKVEIRVHFKGKIKKAGFSPRTDGQGSVVVFAISGDKKKPAPKNIPDAYERVFCEALRGDQTIFTSTEEVTAAWKIITPIVERWGEVPLVKYKIGTTPKTTM